MTTTDWIPIVNQHALQVRKSMQAPEFKRLREQLDLSNTDLAFALGISRSVAVRCERGLQAIPEPIARLLRMYVTHGIPPDVRRVLEAFQAIPGSKP